MRLPLIDGQGNFGSMDGDPPAAMRYTEARLARAADALLDDIDKDTVDFQPNYDGSRQEPMVLPARFPNLLVNGAQGIAVGMATNIPPHNLGEVIDACCAYLDNPAITVEELMEHVPGPDFPTGGIIIGRAGVHAAYAAGAARSCCAPSTISRRCAAARRSSSPRCPTRSTRRACRAHRRGACAKSWSRASPNLRDESDRDGVRVVVELKRDADPEIVLNQLYRYTPLQTSFGVNMLALNGGRPELMTLRDIIAAFVAFREEVVTRRTIYLLSKARERAHILVGLAVAVANIDADHRPHPRRARSRRRARRADRAALAGRRCRPLAGAGRRGRTRARRRRHLSPVRRAGARDPRSAAAAADRARARQDRRGARRAGHRDRRPSRHPALARPAARGAAPGAAARSRSNSPTPRRTTIEDVEFEADIEALIQREDMVVTVSHAGYIKRVPLSTYRAQRRGGRGRAGMAMREEDFVSEVFVASTQAPVLFFTSSGRVYKLKVYRLPVGTPQARGKAMVNLLPNLAPGETISTVMPLPEDEASWADLHRRLRHRQGQCAAQRALRFRQRPRQRQDRDEVRGRGCRRPADRRRDLHRGRRHPARDPQRHAASASRSTMCACSPAAPRSACAASACSAGDAVISLSVLRHEEVAADSATPI